MTETYDAVTSETNRLSRSGWRHDIVHYDAVSQQNPADITDLRVRLTGNMSFTLFSDDAVIDHWQPFTQYQCRNPETTRHSEKSGWLRGAHNYTATTTLVISMYTERDRIPRIGVHQTISGYGIAGAYVLITGKSGLSTTTKTDARGIWYNYLPVDDYSTADIKSFTESGKVYLLLEQKERLPDDPYIWDEVMSRKSSNKAGFIMISKEV